MTMQALLLVNRQGKVRLAKWCAPRLPRPRPHPPYCARENPPVPASAGARTGRPGELLATPPEQELREWGWGGGVASKSGRVGSGSIRDLCGDHPPSAPGAGESTIPEGGG